MNKRFCALMALAAALGLNSASGTGNPLTAEEAAGDSSPAPDTPRDLIAAWLELQDSEICRELDVEFHFIGNSLKVHCRAEDEKGCRKLEGNLKSLRSANRIDFSVSSLPDENTPHLNDKDPPPSLWNNAELRRFFGDPSGTQPTAEKIEAAERPRSYRDVLKQHLILFAKQTLQLTGKLRRSAEGLPALSRTAMNTLIPRDLRERAASIFLRHLQDMGKQAEQLKQNLRQAYPRSVRQSQSAAGKTVDAGKPRTADAVGISEAARDIASRIHAFIFPQNHTVAVAEINGPNLPESLEDLRIMLRDFWEDWQKNPPAGLRNR